MAKSKKQKPTAPAVKERPRTGFWLWALPLLLGVLAYATMFRNGFVWDDAAYLVRNPAVQRLWPPAWLWGAPGPGFPWLGQRPVTALSFALDYALWKGNTFGFHLTSLLLHLLCIAGVVLLAGMLFKDRLTALAAGALFAVHPGHGEAVVAFLGRSDLLATAFVLLASLAYLKSWEGKWKTLYLGLSAASFLAGCFSKETALSFLGILVLLEGIRIRETKSSWKSALLRALPFLLAVALYGAFRLHAPSGASAPAPGWAKDPVGLAAALFSAFLEYLRLFLFPLSLSPWYQPAALGAASGARALLGALALLLGLGAFILLWKRAARGALALGWLLSGLAPLLIGWLLPFLGLIGLLGLPGPIVAERWLYLPSIGGCLLLGRYYSLLREKAKPSGRALVSLGGLALLALLLWRQVSWTPAWRSEESIGLAIVKASPQSALGYAHLGFALAEQGRFTEAEAELRRAVRLDPGYAQAHDNLGYALWQQGKASEAEQEFREAVRLSPDDADAGIRLGNVLLARSRAPEAEQAYRGAVRSSPGYPEARFNLAVALSVQGKLGEAEAEYRQAIRLRPDYADARNNLGELLGGQGRHREAEEEFREALRARPDHPSALWNLAASLDLQGRRREARPYWERVLKVEQSPRTIGLVRMRLQQPD